MTNDLKDLLDAASADVTEIDFAQRAWAGAQRRRARASRRAMLGAAAAVVAVVLVGSQVTDRGATPPPANPVPSATRPKAQAVWRFTADGTRYVIAPASGTELSLPHNGFSGLDAIDPGSARQDLLDLVGSDPRWRAETPVAVFLEAVDAPTATTATLFRPVFARADGTLATTRLRLGLLHDAGGNPSVPLSVGSMSLRSVAFPQPGKVVVLDLNTGKARSYPVPSTTIQQVRWVRSTPEKVVASGPDGAWLIDTTTPAAAPERLPAGFTGATNTLSAAADGRLELTYWELEGLKRTAQTVTAPAENVFGQTFSANLVAATGVLLDATLEPVGGLRATRGILSVTTYDPNDRRLLVMGESPARQMDCCQVVGLAPQNTILFTNATDAGLWLLQWDPDSGDVGRVFLLKADPAVPPTISLGLNYTN